LIFKRKSLYPHKEAVLGFSVQNGLVAAIPKKKNAVKTQKKSSGVYLKNMHYVMTMLQKKIFKLVFITAVSMK
jgi:hypothetical protein